MAIWYLANQPFSPANGAEWNQYIEWSHLTQLKALVGLDGLLCKRPYNGQVEAEDWNHIVKRDFLLDYFHDLDYLLKKIGDRNDVQVLALEMNPTEASVAAFQDKRFTFLGYDLVWRMGAISALTNGGGYPLAFDNGELSEIGLVPHLARAEKIKADLRKNYLGGGHTDCNVWALWKMNR